jgi:hypothetical protein
MENISYFEAIKLQAEKLGIPMPQRQKTPQEIARDREIADLRKVNEMARDFFHNCLTLTRLGEPGKAYFAGRAISAETIEEFKLGYAPQAWDKLSTAFLKRGVKQEFLLAGGLAAERQNGGGIYDFYETADGKYMSVGSLEPKFFAALCDGLEHPEWRDGKILKTDTAMVKRVFRNVFKTKTRDEWTAVFKSLDACVEPVMDLEEVSEDEHLVHRGMWPKVKVPLSDSRTIKQMGCPMHLSECPPRYDHAGYPEGYHTEEILSSLGYAKKEMDEMI